MMDNDDDVPRTNEISDQYVTYIIKFKLMYQPRSIN